MTDIEIKTPSQGRPQLSDEQKLQNIEIIMAKAAKQLEYQKKYRLARKERMIASGAILQKFNCELCGKALGSKSALNTHQFASKLHRKT